jgi:Holliday junction resolvase RusA-like endonuclease
MTETIQIILPFPPSVNSLFGGGSNQKRFPSKKYKEWLKSCHLLNPLLLDKVELHYRFYFPDARERDTENYIKAVTDYLVKQCVLVNDSWKNILDNRQTPMGIDRVNPRVEIEIKVLHDL